jgi:hypothetical protein
VLVGCPVGVGAGWQALRRRMERRRKIGFLYIASLIVYRPFALL